MTDEPRRGDVVIAATGSGFGGKPRPFIVIQSDGYTTKTILLAGCSTVLESESHIRPYLTLSTTNGLRESCRVMVDVLVTSPRAKIGHVAGYLSSTELAEVDAALLLVLGLADS